MAVLLLMLLDSLQRLQNIYTKIPALHALDVPCSTPLIGSSPSQLS